MLCMVKKRIRIDVEDADGAKYDIKLEGNITLEKIRMVFEAMNMADIEAGSGSQNQPEPPTWTLPEPRSGTP